MAIDAEIEAAVVAMRAIRVKGAKVHEEVVRAYAPRGGRGRRASKKRRFSKTCPAQQQTDSADRRRGALLRCVEPAWPPVNASLTLPCSTTRCSTIVVGHSSPAQP